MTDQLVLDRRLQQELERLAWRRLEVALEEVRAAAAALGLSVDERGALYAPLSLRVDAYLERTRRLLMSRI